MDSKVIVSNWFLSSLSSPSLQFLFADLLPWSLLLERRHDLGFPLFLCRLLVLVILWGLELQTFAQWLSLWQFMHLDPYAGHLSQGLRGCSRSQLLHFNFVGFLSLLCLFTFPFMAFMSFFSHSSCCSCNMVVSYVLAMSMASSKVSCLPFSSNLSWIFCVSFQRWAARWVTHPIRSYLWICILKLDCGNDSRNHRQIRQSSVWIVVAGIAPTWSMGYFYLQRRLRSSCYRFLNLDCPSIARWTRLVLSPFSESMVRGKLGRSTVSILLIHLSGLQFISWVLNPIAIVVWCVTLLNNKEKQQRIDVARFGLSRFWHHVKLTGWTQPGLSISDYNIELNNKLIMKLYLM